MWVDVADIEVVCIGQYDVLVWFDTNTLEVTLRFVKLVVTDDRLFVSEPAGVSPSGADAIPSARMSQAGGLVLQPIHKGAGALPQRAFVSASAKRGAVLALPRRFSLPRMVSLWPGVRLYTKQGEMATNPKKFPSLTHWKLFPYGGPGQKHDPAGRPIVGQYYEPAKLVRANTSGGGQVGDTFLPFEVNKSVQFQNFYLVQRLVKPPPNLPESDFGLASVFMTNAPVSRRIPIVPNWGASFVGPKITRSLAGKPRDTSWLGGAKRLGLTDGAGAYQLQTLDAVSHYREVTAEWQTDKQATALSNQPFPYPAYQPVAFGALGYPQALGRKELGIQPRPPSVLFGAFRFGTKMETIPHISPKQPNTNGGQYTLASAIQASASIRLAVRL